MSNYSNACRNHSCGSRQGIVNVDRGMCCVVRNHCSRSEFTETNKSPNYMKYILIASLITSMLFVGCKNPYYLKKKSDREESHRFFLMHEANLKEISKLPTPTYETLPEYERKCDSIFKVSDSIWAAWNRFTSNASKNQNK
jgi:hypothetical protein